MTAAAAEPQPVTPGTAVTPAAAIDPLVTGDLSAVIDPAATIDPDLPHPLIVPEPELVVRPAVTEPPSARSLRATKDVNGIYHSNAGRGLMWVTLWVVFAAWIVLIGGVVYAAAVT
jgi:hypothetical protein